MNRIFFIVIIYFSLASCTKKEPILDNEKLASIVADMHIADVALEGHLLKERDSLANVYLEKIEIIHEITREQMKSQVELLMEDPERQSQVYDLVIEKIRNAEKEIKKKSDNAIKLNNKQKL